MIVFMNMDEKTIKIALRKGERVTLECKRAKAEVPKSVWATYSAFANTIGGLILLGVNEDMQEKDIQKRYKIIGVDEPMKNITDFWNTLNSDKVNENILLDNDVEVRIWMERRLSASVFLRQTGEQLPVPSITGVSDGVSNRVPNGVSDSAKVIYAFIKDNPNISRNELANLTGISLKNIQKHINKLKELGLIRRVGSPRLGYWEIVE